jgi:hypothetical protein
MADVRGNLDPVAGLHVERHTAVLQVQAGGAGQQDDELVVRLVVPEARRTCLPGRDDALDAPAALLDEKVDVLLRLALRQRR